MSKYSEMKNETHSFAVQIMFSDHHGIDRTWLFKCQECKAPGPSGFRVAHNCASIHLCCNGFNDSTGVHSCNSVLPCQTRRNNSLDLLLKNSAQKGGNS